MTADLTLIKWKWNLLSWTLNRMVICKLMGHHWKRVELFPPECTRCKSLLEQHFIPTAAPVVYWPSEKIV